MTVVADASLVLKWVLQEEHTEDALALRDHWRVTGESLIAPPIFRSEVTIVLYRRVRRGGISQSDAFEALDAVLSLVKIDEPPDLYRRAIELAGALKLGSTYDALYLSLAEASRCIMWTADLRLGAVGAAAVRTSPLAGRGDVEIVGKATSSPGLQHWEAAGKSSPHFLAGKELESYPRDTHGHPAEGLSPSARPVFYRPARWITTILEKLTATRGI